MDVGHPDSTRAGAAAIADSGRRPAKANLSRAKDWHGAGRFDDAAREYEAVLAERPDDAEASRFYGILKFQRGDLAEAEALLRRAVSLAPDAESLSDLGEILAANGSGDLALEQFDAALRLDPNYASTLVRQGNALTGMRRYEAALAAYDQALKVSPLLADALCNRGTALRALGRQQEARETYERALTVNPRSFESYYNLGNVLRDLQRYAEALQNYERALAIVPNQPEILSVRGRTLIDLGRPKEALASFNEAIATKPDHVEAVYNSAVALERLGRGEEAIQRCDRVLALEPGHAKAYATRGNALLHQDRHEDALADYTRSLELEPGAADVLCNQGTTLRQLKRHEAALQSYDAALAASADFPEAWCNRGSVLQDMHRYGDALVAFDRALAINPKYALAWFNRGNALFDTLRFDEALQAYDQAIDTDPNYVDAHFAQGFIHLHRGDFARGWPKYEWRLRDPKSEHSRRYFAQPRWSGEESLDGRTILIYAEQGFGDTVQFCRYVQRLLDLGARVVLQVQPALRSLMATLRGPVQVVATGEPLPAFDYQCPLLSLPLAFQTDLSNIPNQTPYLHADAQLVEKWEGILGPKQRSRIGLAWSGNPEHRNDRKRSLDLTTLMPLLELDVEWVSLQKVVRESDMGVLEQSPILNFDADIRDFSDTAALIHSLDLVIAVDTAVAHLAGALGHPVWVLLPHLAEWRWMSEREDSPWYPDARLFQQAAPGGWPGVIDAVREAIVGLA
ncbi:glycosyltransferase 9 family protein [Caballeronia mineralivorans PML1(12)]|uniref:Glycosyltransferase 9 family protein n=1 Tax=Caballeronia mineralivorans PML1(12) TaxID=908627 RepID=A0A0J1CWB4_9BURK|nr:tetratricopeptide repeat protein [Caballeronia mineralivorans]KLU24874.1 glycosyltransferase 9 family protein [Caballeronia mineralivorans PML1(12)]